MVKVCVWVRCLGIVLSRFVLSVSSMLVVVML